MVPRLLLVGFGVVGWLAAAPPARADHFAIDLHVKAGRVSKTVAADTLAPGRKPRPRQTLPVRAGEPIQVHWTVTCTARKAAFNDVIVHLFVVKESAAGQEVVPRLDPKDVPAESALSMDFKPQRKARGEMEVRLTKPGAYLLRLETIGAAVGLEAHEHLAALDLVVK